MYIRNKKSSLQQNINKSPTFPFSYLSFFFFLFPYFMENEKESRNQIRRILYINTFHFFLSLYNLI